MARGDSNSGGVGARRGGRKSRPSGPVPRDVLVSKKLSWLLRHGAEKEGLVLGEGGYARLDAVLQNKTIVSVHTSLAEIKTIVAENDKQRFSLLYNGSTSNLDESVADSTPRHSSAAALQATDPDASNYLIRANQGHSLTVSSTGLLTPLRLINDDGTSTNDLPATVVHGTRHEAWPAILKSGGLKSMRRTHVHFATGVPKQLQSSTENSGAVSRSKEASINPKDDLDDTSVISPEAEAPIALSGMRTTSTILMFLDLRKALAGGLPFWMSDNGVVLSEGDSDGLVPLTFFRSVEEKGGRILLEDGKMIAEADISKFRNHRKGEGA